MVRSEIRVCCEVTGAVVGDACWYVVTTGLMYIVIVSSALIRGTSPMPFGICVNWVVVFDTAVLPPPGTTVVEVTYGTSVCVRNSPNVLLVVVNIGAEMILAFVLCNAASSVSATLPVAYCRLSVGSAGCAKPEPTGGPDVIVMPGIGTKS